MKKKEQIEQEQCLYDLVKIQKKRNCRKMRGKKEKKSTGKVEREPENI